MIGFGTNDLGTWPDVKSTSRRIIENLERIVQSVRDRGKVPLLFNVPYTNESMLTAQVARDTHEKRDYHNGRLRQFCSEHSIPLADICSCLRDEHLGDELHPSEIGALVIAEEIFRVLVPILKNPNVQSYRNTCS